MKKLWAAVILSLLLNALIIHRIRRDEEIAQLVINEVAQMLLVLDFQVKALSH